MIITIQTFYFETTNFKLQDFTSSEVLSGHTSQCSQFEKIIPVFYASSSRLVPMPSCETFIISPVFKSNV